MSNTTSVTFRMNSETKEQVEDLAEKLGTNLSNVMNILAAGFVRNQGFVKEYAMVEEWFNEDTLAALKESEEIAKAVREMTYKGKKYTDREKIVKDIQADIDEEFAEWEKAEEAREVIEKQNSRVKRTRELVNA